MQNGRVLWYVFAKMPGGGGGCDSDIIVTGVVIALLGLKFGGLLPVSALKFKIERNIFGALKRLPRASWLSNNLSKPI